MRKKTAIIILIGLFPLLGNFADGANAAISTYRGDYIGATMDGVSAIPAGGWATGAALTGTRIVRGATKIVTPVVNTVRRAWSSVTTFAKGLSSSIVSGVKKAFNKTPNKRAYRAVSEAELDDIAEHGFRPHPEGLSMEDKWFSETREGATQFTERYDDLNHVVEADVPSSIYKDAYKNTNIDNTGPGFVVPSEKLPEITPIR